MPLTSTAIKNAKPRKKPYKMGDSGGLFLLVNTKGGKWWRLKYRYLGNEKLISLGTYPQTSLKEAREKREATKKLLEKGIDPSEQRKLAQLEKQEKAKQTFEAIALEWIEKQKEKWSPSNTKKVTRRLEKDVFPWLGSKPISDIKPIELLNVLKKVEDRGAIDTAHRVLQTSGQIFRYAVATARAPADITLSLRGALPPAKGSHFSTITEPKEIGALLRAIDGYQGTPVTQAALKFAPLVFVRPGELRHAKWSEIDLKKAVWTIPAEKMKMGHSHIVPLSKQSIKDTAKKK